MYCNWTVEVVSKVENQLEEYLFSLGQKLLPSLSESYRNAQETYVECPICNENMATVGCLSFTCGHLCCPGCFNSLQQSARSGSTIIGASIRAPKCPSCRKD